jgi:N-acetylglutamate synthase-like GNAT family acetyltransferase
MNIIDLTPENEAIFFICLEDWSDDVKDSGQKRAQWYAKMRPLGLGVKLAVDDKGQVGGMIQYLPVEHSTVEGKDIYMIQCIWVHGHKKGRGNFQGKGMGKALLKAAEEDIRARGAKGVAAWGLSLPFWMKASWFKKQGFVKVDKNGMAVLMWKPFSPDAQAPRWIKERKRPAPIPGKVVVSSFVSGWCMVQNLAYERAKRASSMFPDKVVFQEFDTTDMANLKEWGIADGLFIDGKPVNTGPPPSFEKIKKLVEKKVRKL